jgi:hypothetical protein
MKRTNFEVLRLRLRAHADKLLKSLDALGSTPKKKNQPDNSLACSLTRLTPLRRRATAD